VRANPTTMGLTTATRDKLQNETVIKMLGQQMDHYVMILKKLSQQHL
jgi:hypothetical protein